MTKRIRKSGLIRNVVLLLSLITMCFSSVHATEAITSNQRILKLMDAANAGDAVAQYKLGEAYHGGVELPRDIVKANEWFHKSAEQGYAPAEARYGNSFIGGSDGITEDHAEAEKWFQKAAAQGNFSGKFGLLLEQWHVYKLRTLLPEPIRAAVFFLFVLSPFIILSGLCALTFLLFKRKSRKGSFERKDLIYSSRQVWAGSLLGGPLAAIYFVKANYQALGEFKAARVFLFIGVLLTIGMVPMLFFLPEGLPSITVPIVYSSIALALATHHKNDLPRRSSGEVISITILMLILFILLFIIEFFTLSMMHISLIHHAIAAKGNGPEAPISQ